MNFKIIEPWQLKLIAKIVLRRIPIGYPIWRKFGLFLHGKMDDPEYAFAVVKQHFDRSKVPRLQSAGFVALELGPGDSLYSALIANALGATSSYLIDSGKYAHENIMQYKNMASYLEKRGCVPLSMIGINCLEDVLRACNSHYKTEGLISLRGIPDHSVDFIWSQAVLEHIKKEEFFPTMRELRRILKSDGVCSHRVDLKDHLGGALNNLRFTEKVWESAFMSRSGFYTNRIRYQEMLNIFRQAGFQYEVREINKWSILPTRRDCISADFRNLSDDELCISGFDVILK